MKKLIFLVLVSLIAFNAQAEETKIGYVDLQKVVTTSDQGREAMKTLSSIEKVKKALIKEKVDTIRSLEADLAKQASILNPETKKEKQAELEKLVAEYQKMRRESEEELQKNEAELIQKIVLDVNKLLEKIAKEEGYTAILNKPAVLYISDEFDLTGQVLTEINKASQSN